MSKQVGQRERTSRDARRGAGRACRVSGLVLESGPGVNHADAVLLDSGA